jgi:hypothetical protein
MMILIFCEQCVQNNVQGSAQTTRATLPTDRCHFNDAAVRINRDHIRFGGQNGSRGNMTPVSWYMMRREVLFRVTEVTRADVAKFHHDLRHIPYQATRCLDRQVIMRPQNWIVFG